MILLIFVVLIQCSDQPQALSGTDYPPRGACVRVYDVYALD